jgi:NAD(P)-dependent dehydrogenase (short-subunit alcohol dehydrogenase family)
MAVSFDLSGRRILVVGASSGIGRAVGRLAGRSGASVAFAGRRAERLEAAAAEAGEGAVAIPCDVCRADDCADVVDQAVAALGGLDALVYATGMSPLAMLAEARQEEWRAVLDTNVVGAALVSSAAVPHLREAGGRAVYVSSYSVRQSLPGLALYRISKVALDALIEGLRMEHPEVDFTRVVLGNTSGTEFAQQWGSERTAAATKLWVDRGLFPAATMMPIGVAAEAIVSVLAVRGYVDDIAVMPRAVDAAAPTRSIRVGEEDA